MRKVLPRGMTRLGLSVGGWQFGYYYTITDCRSQASPDAQAMNTVPLQRMLY